MLAIIVALLVLALAVLGVYLLLKSMGEDGVEAAAPGSCKSGRCGVQAKPSAEAGPTEGDVQIIRLDEIRRNGGPSKPSS